MRVSMTLTGRAAAGLLLFFATAFGCGASSDTSTAPSAAPAAPRAIRRAVHDVDLAHVMTTARHAFRADGATWRGGGTTYATTFEGGAFTFAATARSGKSAHARFETASIARGAASANPAAPARLDRDGSVVVARGAIVERVRNVDAGVEQAWELARAPDGDGDLVVRVAVGGADYAGRTERGLHFVDRASGLFFRYGDIAWVGADGARTPLAASYDAKRGAVAIVIPAAILASSTYPATLDPTVSAETALDNPILAPPVTSEDAPAAAFDGTNNLVVWLDNRSLSGNGDLFAKRVSPTGFTVDATGFPIVMDAAVESAPAIAFGGGVHFVVWSTPGGIFAARVLPSSTVMDPTPLAINASGTAPAVAFDGTNFLVAWRTSQGGIQAARVTPAGSVVDPGGFVVGSGTTASTPRVAFGGGEYLVVWRDARNGAANTDIYASRVTTAGLSLDPIGMAVTTNAGNQLVPDVAWNRSTFLVVWEDDAQTAARVFGGRVSTAGVAIDGSGFLLSSSATSSHTNPRLGGDPTQNVDLVWFVTQLGTTLPEVLAGSISGGAGSLSGVVNVDHTASQKRSIAIASGSSMLLWGDDRSDLATPTYAIYAATWQPFGFGTESIIGQQVNSQTWPSVASDGTNYLVVWQDGRDAATGYDIFGARVDSSGNVLDANGIAISTAAGDQTSPRVVFDGTEFVVASERASARRAFRSTR
jgi:hypothetical protein